jgi:hypothetical protein
MRFLSDVKYTQDHAFALCKGFCIPFYALIIIGVNHVWTFCHIVYQLQKEGYGRS